MVGRVTSKALSDGKTRKKYTENARGFKGMLCFPHRTFTEFWSSKEAGERNDSFKSSNEAFHVSFCLGKKKDTLKKRSNLNTVLLLFKISFILESLLKWEVTFMSWEPPE